MLHANEDLARKLAALEVRYDARFRIVFEAIKELMAPPEGSREPIGFRLDEREDETGGPS